MTAVDSSTVRTWRPGLWDVVVGLAVVALGAKVLAGTGGGDGFRAADPLAYVLTAIGCATTVWARRQPLAALMVTGLMVTTLVARDYHADFLPFVFTGLLFMVASYRPRQSAVGGLRPRPSSWRSRRRPARRTSASLPSHKRRPSSRSPGCWGGWWGPGVRPAGSCVGGGAARRRRASTRGSRARPETLSRSTSGCESPATCTTCSPTR